VHEQSSINWPRAGARLAGMMKRHLGWDSREAG
jgi:hypothetical protein